MTEIFEIATPDKYKSQERGSLKKKLMENDTYRWLCAEHRKKQ